MKLTKPCVLAVSLVASFCGASAMAGTLSPFTGYTVFSEDCSTCDSTTNFSVWHNTDGDWSDDLFFGSAFSSAVGFNGNAVGSIDTSANFVYMYQVVNSNPRTESGIDNALASLGVTVESDLITSGGYFAGHVFQTNEAVPQPIDGTPENMDGTSTAVGSLNAPTPPLDVPDDGAPAVNGLTTGLVRDAGAVPANSFFLNQNLENDNFFADMRDVEGVLWGFTGIPTGGYTSVLFMTSNHGPRYTWGETDTGGIGALGDVPTPVPLPMPAMLLISGLGGFAFLRRRGRRRA
ncbi:hypothetical protein AB2B41_17725 [Marimonas sp. MJW-29]|uniref:VPLPA-CTERM protein sorting domain-containing protein n=1 Tax=Sulfitobacter sediminis TaxID=3234186 RepID=A0ABV3RSB4_9RHOB